MSPLPAISMRSQELLSTATAPALSWVKQKLKCVQSSFLPHLQLDLLEGVFVVLCESGFHVSSDVVVMFTEIWLGVRNRRRWGAIVSFAVPD